MTPNSRFDKWLAGDKKALSRDEVAGYELFRSSGCAMCHRGPAAGGTAFQKMGIVEPYKTDNPAEGRIAVTKTASTNLSMVELGGTSTRSRTERFAHSADSRV